MKRRPWEPDLDFYHSSWKSAPLIITVDLGAEDVAPLQTHPLRLQARVPLRQPRPDGLRDLNEAEALYALEDLLTQKLGGLAPVLQVGRVIGASEMTLVWYAPASVEAQKQALADAVREVRGRYEVRLSTAEDPAWGFYFDFLLPDVYNLQVMLNRRRLLTLGEHGDEGSRPRLVTHRALFATAAEAEAAARALAAQGFEVDEPSSASAFDEDWPEDWPEDLEDWAAGESTLTGGSETPARAGPEGEVAQPEAGAPTPASNSSFALLSSRFRPFAADRRTKLDSEPWLLEFVRVDRLADGRIDDVCVEILDAILPHDGHYEGWGSELIPGGATCG